jgi:hypothetical protein
MASLQARHSRSCELGRPWTTFADATKRSGCTCTPLYHVVLRHDGKLVREQVGHNRREAVRAILERSRRTYERMFRLSCERWRTESRAGRTPAS